MIGFQTHQHNDCNSKFLDKIFRPCEEEKKQELYSIYVLTGKVSKLGREANGSPFLLKKKIRSI